MNHSLPGLNANYITPHRFLENRLRDVQEKIPRVVVEAAQARRPCFKPVAGWLRSCRIQPDLLQVNNSFDVVA